MDQLALPDFLPPVPAPKNGKKGTALDQPAGPFTYEGDGPNAWSPKINWSSNLLGMLGLPGDFAEVSAGEAVRQGAVMACLDIMAQDISRAPITLNRMLTQGQRRRGYEVMAPRAHPLARLFWLKPNRFMTWQELKTMVIYHLGLVNNAYLIPVKDRLGRVQELIPVLPSRVQIDVNREMNTHFYRVRAGSEGEALMLGAEDELIFFPNEIIHMKTRVMNGFSGISTVQVGNKVLALTEAVVRFQDRLFRRDGMLRGVFQQHPQSTQELSQVQYDRLKASLGEALSMLRNLGHPLILEGGLEFKPISMTAAEAGADNAWKQQIEETARLFRIPPHKLMHFDGTKYENMESLERMYVTDSLEPRCHAIEERLTLQLLTEDEQMDFYIEFDREELHRPDQKSLHERIIKLWDAGVITQDEAREKLGYNPAKSGEIYKMSANTFLVDADHEVVVTNQPSPGDPGQSGGDSGAVTDETGDGNQDED
jgi:HK97 family phage portal protein